MYKRVTTQKCNMPFMRLPEDAARETARVQLQDAHAFPGVSRMRMCAARLFQMYKCVPNRRKIRAKFSAFVLAWPVHVKQ